MLENGKCWVRTLKVKRFIGIRSAMATVSVWYFKVETWYRGITNCKVLDIKRIFLIINFHFITFDGIQYDLASNYHNGLWLCIFHISSFDIILHVDIDFAISFVKFSCTVSQEPQYIILSEVNICNICINFNSLIELLCNQAPFSIVSINFIQIC